MEIMGAVAECKHVKDGEFIEYVIPLYYKAEDGYPAKVCLCRLCIDSIFMDGVRSLLSNSSSAHPAFFTFAAKTSKSDDQK